MELKKLPGPDCVYYYPNYLSSEEESYLLNQFHSVPTEKWIDVNGRKLLNYGGDNRKSPMLLQKMPNFINVLLKKIEKDFISQFPIDGLNHCLLNRYEAEEGIFDHQDGDYYEPFVFIISIGSTRLLRFNPVQKDGCESLQSCSVCLEPRSLIIFHGKLYDDYTHSISKGNEQTGVISLEDHCLNKSIPFSFEKQLRFSLTFRKVKKVIDQRKLFGVRR